MNVDGGRRGIDVWLAEEMKDNGDEFVILAKPIK